MKSFLLAFVAVLALAIGATGIIFVLTTLSDNILLYQAFPFFVFFFSGIILVIYYVFSLFSKSE
jgi:hypothetical protein